MFVCFFFVFFATMLLAPQRCQRRWMEVCAIRCGGINGWSPANNGFMLSRCEWIRTRDPRTKHGINFCCASWSRSISWWLRLAIPTSQQL